MILMSNIQFCIMNIDNCDKDTMLRIVENAIEIADGNLPILQDRFQQIMGRQSIIANYIFPWSIEAEKQWEKLLELNEEKDYYDFIDQFAKQKIAESLCQENYGIETK